MRLKGIYRCSCGARKAGEPNSDGQDLRAIVGLPVA